MIKDLITLFVFFSAGMLMMYLKDKIFNKAKEVVKETASTKEAVDVNKLKKIFTLTSAVEWIKSIKEILDLRKLIIYLTIVGIIFGYGWWKGKQDRPIVLDLRYGKETVLILNGEQLHIDKNGHVFVEDSKTGKIIKQLSVKDVPGLSRTLAPYGFKLEPFVLGGGGISGKGEVGLEVGAGVSLIQVWKANLDAFLTNRGVYGGVSYKITDNSGIGLGVGKGWEGDNRAIIYYKFRF